MAYSGAHRQPASLDPQIQALTSHHHHHLHSLQDQTACTASRNSNKAIAPTIMAASNIYNHPQHQQQLHHHHHHQRSNGAAAIGVGVGVGPVGSGCIKSHYKGHQRRQSVARLLPDISKLRLLSWLVEASNELINCDIAIMDGVYAKLNRSRESLLFWQQSQAVSSAASAASRLPPPPPPPNVQPVANKLVISQVIKHQQQHKQQKSSSHSGGAGSNKHQRQSLNNNNIAANHQDNISKSKLGRNKSNSLAGCVSRTNNGGVGGRIGHNHHSLPASNCAASSLAALSLQSNNKPTTTTVPLKAGRADNDTESIVVGSSASATIMMMQQNLERKADIAAAAAASGSKSAHACAGGGQPTTTLLSGSAAAVSSLPLEPICDNHITDSLGSTAAPATTTSLTVPTNEPHYDCDNSNNQSEAEEDEDVDDDVVDNDEDDCDVDDDEVGGDGDDDDDDDDDNSSAASSTTSSGIHGASVSSSASSSSSASTSSSSSSSSSVSSSCASSTSAGSSNLFGGSAGVPARIGPASGGFGQQHDTSQLSSAEQLSERIRRSVMEHNYLQNLLVNVIRQHDRQRDLLNQQRQAAADPTAAAAAPLMSSRIDLADIADALDDGCQCSCHRMRRLKLQHHHHHQKHSHDSLGANSTLSSLSSLSSPFNNKSNKKASTLPSSSSLSLFQPQNQAPATATRKNRRKKNNEPSREDMLRKLSNKLCENCFETHYWLFGCSLIELTPATTISTFKGNNATGQLNSAQSNSNSGSGGGGGGNKTDQTSHGGGNSNGNNLSASLASDSQQQKQQQKDSDKLDAILSLRNATFIKLVQQQVRSTISNSIELIDLIRKEIKSPESIKQKQLMRCFSASIQLLSSVANYVVPSQDISTFIPAEIMASQQQRPHHHHYNQPSQQQQQRNSPPATVLFNLPPADFDHLYMHPLLSASAGPSSASAYGAPAPAGSDQSIYHLAPALEIPIRRRHNLHQFRQRRSSDDTNMNVSRPGDDHDSFISLPFDGSISSTPLKGQQSPGGEKQKRSDRIAAKLLYKSNKTTKSNENQHPGATLGAANTNPNAVDSSSGASSNNSSASSSIARGQVQQSSLTKAHTAGAILDGKTSHDLTFDSIASLSQDRHQQLSGFQSGRAKFWQSSKFNFIKKLLQVKQQRLLRQQSKDRRIYNNKVQNKFRLVMMDLTHFNKSQQLLSTENGVNSLLTSMRNVLEFGLYLTVKLY